MIPGPNGPIILIEFHVWVNRLLIVYETNYSVLVRYLLPSKEQKIYQKNTEINQGTNHPSPP
jgi:hypothetical protein